MRDSPSRLELLQVETGSLYPALYRLEVKGSIAASWALSEKGNCAAQEGK